ncbi:MAG: glutathione S-transferase N-terminal domain-containing protein [Hyphomicrobiaceae bacterium]|nr:glutathione S-transferase N-terminal domain-containing protein [Hyphomicrobiaceae bacterium]
MKIYGTMVSPYVRKVRVVLCEKGIACSFEILNVMEPNCPVIGHNPLGKIPVMVLDNGFEIFDSRVIVEYIDTVSAGSRLLPVDPLERAEVRRCEALADGVVEAGSLVRVETSRAPELRNQAQIDRQMGKLNRGLGAMSNQIGDKSWCCLEEFTLADVAFVCSLGWICFRFPQLDWRLIHPRLAEYYARLSGRSSFEATAPSENPALPAGTSRMVPLVTTLGMPE